jgi:AraC-like DNA-binding protein
MDYKELTWVLMACIEQNIKSKPEYRVFEQAVGFSYRHIRDVFKRTVQISLSRYILARKIANAAFELRHTHVNITCIALDYGFANTETFTRAFHRVTGITPSAFKKSDYPCGRQIICPGVYAPVILGLNESTLTLQHLKEVNKMSEMKKTADSCVLYGVPKVFKGREVDGDKQTLPFPMCLQAVLNYMGQNISYAELLAYSGEAFRQRWEGGWSPASIDPRVIYERPLETYERAFKGAGRKFVISVDSNNTKAIIKDDVIPLIKEELDCGRPIIALGVVGPPEACIITGYKNNGETVLGWSLFQEGNNPWSGCEKDESGYFIKNDWWKKTQGIMIIGEEIGERTPDLAVLKNAVMLLTAEKVNVYNNTWQICGATEAYEAWAAALEANDFNPNGAKSGHIDAERMAGEGRKYAADYMLILAEKYPKLFAEFSECTKLFRATADNIQSVAKLREDNGLEDEEIRKKMAAHIRQAAQSDKAACKVLQGIIAKMGDKKQRRK